MRPRLDDEKRAAGSERKTALLAARPNRSEFAGEIKITELVENQQILALAVLRAANQCDVTLTGRDPRQRDPGRVNAGGFLTHEGTRRPGYAMDNGDIAGQQIRQLRQKKGRTQIVHQPLIEKSGSGIALCFR